MSFLTDTISKQVNIPQEHLAEIKSKFTCVDLSRKSLLVSAGEIANKLAVIETGYLRMFRIDTSGKETTIWIGSSGKFITSVSSFVNQQPSHWNIEALTDAKLHVIKIDSHAQLCSKFREWLDFENLLLSKAIGALEFRTFELMSMKAEERFQVFFKRNSQLFLDIPSKYIASLLGISEETLSRLKRNN